MDTLLLNSDAVDANARMDAVIRSVEEAFKAYQRGDVRMPAKSYVELARYNGDFRSMPAYMDAGDWDAAGVKWVNVHPDNPEKHGLPTVMGTMVYSDPETAYPLAVMDGTTLTMQRTGAAAAVATDHFAVEDATTLGIVGAGVQSHTQLEAIAEVRPIEEVVVAAKDPDRIDAFRAEFEGRFTVREGSTAEAASCDVLSTVTPVRDPIVSLDDLGEHTHVNAMGADAEGKQELEDDVVLSSKLVIDDHEQCTHSGEVNVPWGEGTLGDDDIYGEVGEIVTGEKDGRTADDGVTVFDSTGLAIQDVAAARVVFDEAKEAESGHSFDIVQA